jgi:hypothetical protein
MAIKALNTPAELAYALVAAQNQRVTDEISTTKFHKCRYETTVRPDYQTYSVSRLTVTTADGTDAPTTLALCNAIKAFLNTNFADTDTHLVADATNVVSTADGTNAATTQTLANAMKANFNGHLTQAGVHSNNDGTNTVATADGTDAATTLTLANAIKAKINLHIASAPNGTRIDIQPQ